MRENENNTATRQEKGVKQTQRHDAIIELVKKQGYVSSLPSARKPSVATSTISQNKI